MEGVPVRLPRREQLHRNPQWPRMRESTASKRTSATSRGGLTLNAAAAYTDAKTKGNICTFVATPIRIASASSTAFRTFHLRRAARDCRSRRSSRRLRPRATAGRRGPTSKRTSRAESAYRGSAPSSLRTAIALVGTGEIVNPNDFQGRLHAATLVDLYAGFDWPRWNVELFATNIFDKRIDISRQTACGSCTRALVVPGRPRTIGIRAGDEVLARAPGNVPRRFAFEAGMSVSCALRGANRASLVASWRLAAIWLAMLLWGGGRSTAPSTRHFTPDRPALVDDRAHLHRPRRADRADCRADLSAALLAVVGRAPASAVVLLLICWSVAA